MEKEVWVTCDGREFESKHEAEFYEETLKHKEDLNRFRIEGPKLFPYTNDRPAMADPGYEWYRVNSDDDLVIFRRLLGKIHRTRIPNLQRDEHASYPVYIAYNPFRNRLIDLSELRSIHERTEAEWEELLSALGA